MGSDQENGEQQDSGQIRTLKEKVLTICPEAEVIKREQFDGPYLYLISWPEQSLPDYLCGSRKTEEEAWEQAYKILLKDMIEKLES